MAQKTEKEETEFKVPEALTLCVNNCGFTGNPATNNMCQKCFSATTSATTITTTTSNTSPSNNPTTTTTTVSSSSSSTTAMEVASTTTTTATTSKFMSGSRILKFTGERSVTVRSAAPRSPVKDLARGASQRAFSDDVSRREVNRCTGCRRKVGLTGIRCRCGELFCWEHRYSDRHDCSYDYKSAGREAIARENPVVKAAKIVRV